MSDQYCGEIRMFAGWGGLYCINNWAFCDGTPLQISDNGALYSLIGNIWGGSYQTFNLPDMRGRVPIHQGQSPGLSNRVLGSVFGNEYVTLVEENLPPHNHPLQASNQGATTESPTGAVTATVGSQMFFYDDQTGSRKTVTLPSCAVGDVGNDYEHENCMPSMPLSYIIALKGLYPERH